MSNVKELLDAGVHFGHQKRKWNPKMKEFIFEARNGIHIIDLVQTVTQIQSAADFLKGVVGKGGKVLFVGTKKPGPSFNKRNRGEYWPTLCL